MRISSRRLHRFNPGHETAVGIGQANYTPDAASRRMADDLETLPLWYADSGDSVWITHTEGADQFLDSLPLFLRPDVRLLTADALCRLSADVEGPLLATPWGFSPDVLAAFERLRRRGAPILVPAWSDALRTLTHRQTAARCLERVLRRLPELPPIAVPRFCASVGEVVDYVTTCQAPFMLKTPFSCSGRGILTLENASITDPERRWIEGALRRWGVVSIEPKLDKTADFALEFHSDGHGCVTYAGLSVFDTHPRGAFTGARLGDPDRLRGQLPDILRGPLFDRLRTAVTDTLCDTVGRIYGGYLGVDMLVYRRPDGSAAVHPFIELNLRYTMGLVAVELSRRVVHPDAIGRLLIARCPAPGDALRAHQADIQRLPARFADGRLRAGYLSLVPVTPASLFRAFIEVV